MEVLSIHQLVFVLVLLIVISAFFSGSETGMMSVNRYRLRHLIRQGNGKAKRVSQLLQRPDRLLGVILIGNTFANVLVSMVTAKLFSSANVIVVSIVLTLLLLIFAETAPKTVAALYPEKFAFRASRLLAALLKIFYPLVWFVNLIANSFLLVFRIKVGKRTIESLSVDELRTVVLEAKGKISSNYQQMLLRILELEQVTVVDVMVPRNEITGIDITDDWSMIVQQLINCSHAYLPLYNGDINRIVGVINLRKVLPQIYNKHFSLSMLRSLAQKPYFLPEGAVLNRQLLHFQDQQRSFGLVVDEYGDLIGLVTLQDILEEIVGEFAYSVEEEHLPIYPQKDGSILVDGRMNLRELNRQAQWNWPVDGPKTLSGLVIEYFEMIPKEGICARVCGYPIEVAKLKRNRIHLVRIWPELYQAPRTEDDV